VKRYIRVVDACGNSWQRVEFMLVYDVKRSVPRHALMRRGGKKCRGMTDTCPRYQNVSVLQRKIKCTPCRLIREFKYCGDRVSPSLRAEFRRELQPLALTGRNRRAGREKYTVTPRRRLRVMAAYIELLSEALWPLLPASCDIHKLNREGSKDSEAVRQRHLPYI
jgi:hypothetical protein